MGKMITFFEWLLSITLFTVRPIVGIFIIGLAKEVHSLTYRVLSNGSKNYKSYLKFVKKYEYYNFIIMVARTITRKNLKRAGLKASSFASNNRKIWKNG